MNVCRCGLIDYAEGETGFCPGCKLLLTVPVESLSLIQRRREMAAWLDHGMSVPFHELHKRLEVLAGRPVFTHEMGDREYLIGIVS